MDLESEDTNIERDALNKVNNSVILNSSKARPKVFIPKTIYTLSDLVSSASIPTMIQLTTHTVSDVTEPVAFYKTDDHPFNKRGYKYKPSRPNPLFKGSLYSTSDLFPYGVRFDYFDRSAGTEIDNNVTSLTTDAGWRSARSNICISEGRWYFEYVIRHANNNPAQSVHATPHVRIGLGRREAALEAPIGYDAYGYALRDVTGQTVHLSRPKKFLGEGFKSGDVIGFLVELPSIEKQLEIVENQVLEKTPGEPQHAETYFGPVTQDMAHKKRKKAKISEEDERENIGNLEKKQYFDVFRDQVHMKYKSEHYYEQFEYCTTTAFEHLLNPVTVFGEKAVSDSKQFQPAKLPGSKIVVYKNGRREGTAFEDLYAFMPPSSKLTKAQLTSKQYNNDGSLGYYPMASVYKNGVVQLNPGPDFKYLPEEIKADPSVRHLYERYEEKIVQDIVWDIVDEIEYLYLEGNI